ncbi:MAG: FHA domain-containing protein [Thermoanaerobaculia bacterium]|nr:FHA domain-containing protein [Thermoanaerobaculia bacterium]
MSEGWTYQLTFRGDTFELSDGEQIVGRSRASDISVPDASVSRKHARIKIGPGHILIQDLNSSNGTFVNDRRVQGEDAAEDGDLLRFGDAELRVMIKNPGVYQTMRLPSGGGPDLGLPATGPENKPVPGPATTMLAAESVKLAAQTELDSGPARAAAPPGPATTMLAAESVKLAAQMELDGQPAQVAPDGGSTPPIPTSPVSAELPTTTQPVPEPADEPSPLATQRLEVAPAGSPQGPPSGVPEVELPSSSPVLDEPSPHQTQRFDSSSFVPVAPVGTEDPPAAPPVSHPVEPVSSPLETQRLIVGPDPASGVAAAEHPARDSEPSPPPASATPDVEPAFDPAATRRLEIPSQPAPPPVTPPPLPEPPPAATVAMTPEQLEAARAELEGFEPQADAVDSTSIPLPSSEPESTPVASSTEEAAPVDVPAPAAPASPNFGLDLEVDDGFGGFDLDDLPSSSEVRPPEDFVPGSGRAWQSDPVAGLAVPTEPPPINVPDVPLPGVPTSDAVPGPSPPSTISGTEPPAIEPSFGASTSPTVGDSADIAPPSDPVPPGAKSGSEPHFDQPVASWAKQPDDDGDATFAHVEFDSGKAIAPPDEGSWEPPDIEQDGASFTSSWVPGTAPESGPAAADATGPSSPEPSVPHPLAAEPVAPPSFAEPAVPSPSPSPSLPEPPAPWTEAPGPPLPAALPTPAAELSDPFSSLPGQAGPQPATPQPAAPQPATPQPAAPQPATPQPAAPEPAAPEPAPTPTELATAKVPMPLVSPPSPSPSPPFEATDRPGASASPEPQAPIPPSFDKPTPPAAQPMTPHGFDQPMPPASPPPAEMPREERAAGGAIGLLPTLDEIDGAIAAPEVEVPYQPDRDPTQAVPVVGYRRVEPGAGFVLRASAAFLDMMWIGALTWAAWMVSGNDQLVSILVSTICQVGIVVSWAVRGTSPGKKALGLSVEGKVPDPSDPGIGFLRAVIRSAGYLVSALPLGAGFFLIAFSPDRRGLHDRIAGTWVRHRG